MLKLSAKMLRLTAKFAIFGLVAIILVPSVMACVLPASSLSAEERACCREMAGNCGEMDMPSSHSCCKTLPAPELATVAKAPFNPSIQLEIAYFVEPADSSLTVRSEECEDGMSISPQLP